MHAVVAQTLSVCHEQKNETPEAARVLNDVLQESHAEDNAYVRLRTYGKVGRLLALQGQLRRARTLYEQGLREARAQNHLPLTGELQIGLGDLLREEDRLEEAQELVEAGVERSVDLHQLGAILRGYVCLARIAEGRADEAAARAWLGRAQERVAGGGRPEHRRYVRAHRARLDARLGDAAAALSWAESCGLSPQSPLSPANEFEHLILARVLLAARLTSGLHAHLERLLAFAAQGRRTRRVVEILLLQTLLHHKRGDVAAAHRTLEEALALTGSEPYLRTFLDEGPLVLQLVRAVADEKESGHTAERIITAAARQALLIDPLSPREREVLALIAEGLTNRAIAERLYISFNTVIWHVRNLYRKLGVNNRTQAVARGRDLGLL
jgi:LuxR family maltose regulon positive regulatory protein